MVWYNRVTRRWITPVGGVQSVIANEAEKLHDWSAPQCQSAFTFDALKESANVILSALHQQHIIRDFQEHPIPQRHDIPSPVAFEDREEDNQTRPVRRRPRRRVSQREQPDSMGQSEQSEPSPVGHIEQLAITNQSIQHEPSTSSHPSLHMPSPFPCPPGPFPHMPSPTPPGPSSYQMFQYPYPYPYPYPPHSSMGINPSHPPYPSYQLYPPHSSPHSSQFATHVGTPQSAHIHDMTGPSHRHLSPISYNEQASEQSTPPQQALASIPSSERGNVHPTPAAPPIVPRRDRPRRQIKRPSCGTH